MTLPLITFVLTLTLIIGSYWIFVVRPEAQLSGRLKERLQLKRDQPVGTASVVKAPAAADGSAGLVGRIRRWHERYAVTAAARLIESAGMRTDPHWLIVSTGISLVVVVTLLGAINAAWHTRLAAGVITPLVPYFYIRYMARARLKAFEELFPDAISLMARALRAGHALTTTLSLVADETPEPVKSEFRGLYQQHSYGLPMQQVLRTFAKRIPIMDVQFFATAVLTQRETGGNLSEVLDNLAGVMRDRFRVRRQLSVLTAQGRTTGWFLAAVPIGVGAAMYMLNPTQMTAFIADPTGFKLLMTALGLELVGVVAIRRIVAVDY
jgi:tight adherence protein B